MLYDKKMYSLKDKIQENELGKLGTKKDKKVRGSGRPSDKKGKKYAKKK